MKAVVEFDMVNEREEFNLYLISSEMAAAIVNLDAEMRNIVKHGHSFKTVDELADHVRDRLLEVRNKIEG